ncbi:MAG: PTS sugar transporter subunit IIA [Candidatus Omnitrophica bacterium]|nr:PTS sugar transporter subunit IIA [Candidatus Omnitrophota bacterium]
MRVSDYLKEECCCMDLVAQGKDEIIKEIADKVKCGGNVVDENKFIADVLEREALGSTGIGNNVGIPHARTDAVKGFVIGFAKSKEGVDFKALDGQPVKLIFLMGADPKELNFYMRVLAELSKLLMNNAFREELLATTTPKDVVGVIKKFENS